MLSFHSFMFASGEEKEEEAKDLVGGERGAEMVKFAKVLLKMSEMNAEEGGLCHYLFPVLKKIDGVSVEAFFVISSRGERKSISFELRAANVHASRRDSSSTWTPPPLSLSNQFLYFEHFVVSALKRDRMRVGSIVEHLQDLFCRVIPSLRFSVLDSQLYDDAKLTAMIRWDRLFPPCDTVETNFQDCCVCHHPTVHKTKCDHYLCVRCADHLIAFEKKKRDDAQHHHVACPVCRAVLITKQQKYSSHRQYFTWDTYFVRDEKLEKVCYVVNPSSSPTEAAAAAATVHERGFVQISMEDYMMLLLHQPQQQQRSADYADQDQEQEQRSVEGAGDEGIEEVD